MTRALRGSQIALDWVSGLGFTYIHAAAPCDPEIDLYLD